MSTQNTIRFSAIWRWALCLLIGCCAAPVFAQEGGTSLNSKITGATVQYQLPTTGALPRTYLVTLAIVDAKRPEWIICQFVAGEPRSVTAENGGKFVETWDGLDDNFMPVPPGTYGVKGIYMPATKWDIDGEYHAITPQFVAGASCWLPTREQRRLHEPFGGDPVGAPMGDIDVGPNGIAVFYYGYLENGTNNPMFDLNKPISYDQFVRAFPSGGAGGGDVVCTDGETVWAFGGDGGKQFVYRADGRPFGDGSGAYRNGVYLPDGWVKDMACVRANGKTYVYVAQAGKIVERKSETEFVDKITVHDGADGKVLREVPVQRPLGITIRGGQLYALQAVDGGYAVAVMSLQDGLPMGDWQRLFAVPAGITPYDVQVDSHGRVYLSDPSANKVYQFDRAGKKLLTYGHLDEQQPGSYDPLTLMMPGKLASWVDANGQDRLIIVEKAGPNRCSEWSADGKLLREYQSLQTTANSGYAIDPAHPDQVYVLGQQNWLTRFTVDYVKGTWTVNAVWPHIGDDPKAPDFDHPRFIRLNGQQYIACGRSYNPSIQNIPIYRLEGNRWQLSAAIVTEVQGNTRRYYTWHDVNGDGKVEEEEYKNSPLEMPGWLLRYQGAQWSDDLALVAPNMGGLDIWQLAPSGYDAHGNPIFSAWQKLFTDPVFAARIAGTADAVHGGNELDNNYSNDWDMADGTTAEGYVVAARGGKNFSANFGAQMKVTRYLPDGQGGYRMIWRTGRAALQRTAARSESYGLMHITKPINGLVSVVDQSRCGVLLYNAEDGLYVDTLFPGDLRLPTKVTGLYGLPGEFFAGATYANAENGKIYFAAGKISPLLFEMQGWSLTENPVHKLTLAASTVMITAAQIASPPEIALTLRGGAGTAWVARFAPALGGAVLDGSMAGWESTEPISFQADKENTVEVRGLYDPNNLYLRWHARLATKVDPKPAESLERLFTHDRQGDTLSFYIQGQLDAAPGPVGGRAGDVRFVFSLVKNGDAVKPVVVGMYPQWNGPGPANPTTYHSLVGEVKFAHVGEVKDATLNYTLDADGKGFVIATAIPRADIPGLPLPDDNLHTMVNFEATFGGHNKFWWSNADGSASRETFDEPTEARLYPNSWAPVQFKGLTNGVLVRKWQLVGPFGGPGAEKFTWDLRGLPAGRTFCEASHFPPDDGKVDLTATFTGAMVQGYWQNPGTLRWHEAMVADLDTRIICGNSAQVWYGATWIYSAQALTLDFQFQGHPKTYFRWFLNGQQVFTTKEIPGDPTKETTKTLTLRQGWNQVMFRGYCAGYPPFRAGLVLNGPPEMLWQLRLSATPPKE